MIKTILAEVKSEKDCSEILKDLIETAEKNETIFGFTAVMGALRFKIAELIYGLLEFINKNKK